MNDEDKKQLTGLRDEIVEALNKDMMEDASPAEKTQLLLVSYRNSGDFETIQKAHKAAESIEDDAERSQALLNILDEIEYQFQKAEADKEQAQTLAPEKAHEAKKEDEPNDQPEAVPAEHHG